MISPFHEKLKITTSIVTLGLLMMPCIAFFMLWACGILFEIPMASVSAEDPLSVALLMLTMASIAVVVVAGVNAPVFLQLADEVSEVRGSEGHSDGTVEHDETEVRKSANFMFCFDATRLLLVISAYLVLQGFFVGMIARWSSHAAGLIGIALLCVLVPACDWFSRLTWNLVARYVPPSVDWSPLTGARKVRDATSNFLVMFGILMLQIPILLAFQERDISTLTEVIFLSTATTIPFVLIAAIAGAAVAQSEFHRAKTQALSVTISVLFILFLAGKPISMAAMRTMGMGGKHNVAYYFEDAVIPRAAASGLFCEQGRTKDGCVIVVNQVFSVSGKHYLRPGGKCVGSAREVIGMVFKSREYSKFSDDEIHELPTPGCSKPA